MRLAIGQIKNDQNMKPGLFQSDLRYKHYINGV